VRAHIAPRELGAATPTALHARPSWAPDEIECRVLLKLPDTWAMRACGLPGEGGSVANHLGTP